MRVHQVRWRGPLIPEGDLASLAALDPQLLLFFGPPTVLDQGLLTRQVRTLFPQARLAGCSSAGIITAEGAFEEESILTALHLEGVHLLAAWEPLASMADSESAGRRLAHSLCAQHPGRDLDSALLLGQGVQINGSALVNGFQSVLGTDLPLTGALAGDDGAFIRTLTVLDDQVSPDHVLALGFSGKRLAIQTAAASGWEPFGPLRRVTAARDNILESLDGEPALAVYRRYLGAWADSLPASALLFPLALLEEDPGAPGLVRTVLGVSESEGHLILAGDLAQGSLVRLMHASTSTLVAGARQAASRFRRDASPALALTFSCVGRKLVMGQRVDEEIHALCQGLGPDVPLAGFFSYGEIGPLVGRPGSHLHNQTLSLALMTAEA